MTAEGALESFAQGLLNAPGLVVIDAVLASVWIDLSSLSISSGSVWADRQWQVGGKWQVARGKWP